MKKTIVLFCHLLFFCIPVFAQTPYRNMEKYWWYRYRLVNDFMKIGPNCGESIPAVARTYPDVYGSPG